MANDMRENIDVVTKRKPLVGWDGLRAHQEKNPKAENGNPDALLGKDATEVNKEEETKKKSIS